MTLQCVVGTPSAAARAFPWASWNTEMLPDCRGPTERASTASADLGMLPNSAYGQVIDVYVSARRDILATGAFFTRAISGFARQP